MSVIVDPMVTLECDSEVWTGYFPGLGSIAVDADGNIDVAAEPSSEEEMQTRQRALRYGWAEGLSFVRRGFMLAAGAGVVHPGSGESMILTGDAHDVAVALVELSTRDWLTLSDRYTPVQWHGDQLFAYPREAPLLLATDLGQMQAVSGEPARTDTDALIVELPRATVPAVVTSVASIARRLQHDEVLSNLTGQNRFEAASQLILGGILAQGRMTQGEVRMAKAMSETLRLASLRFCALRSRPSNISADIDQLLSWLSAV